MIRIPFTKVHGAGNDFVLIDNIRAKLDIEWAQFARLVCNRQRGVGADGLLVIEASERYHFTMNYFNADGGWGGMCGNGGRAVALYAHERFGLNGTITFDAVGHTYDATVRESSVRLRMADPSSPQLEITIMLNAEPLSLHFIDTGAPHAVVLYDEAPGAWQTHFQHFDVEGWGRAIRNHPFFHPFGTNVDFIRILKDNSIQMRTYERGVEEETLACGTGAVASTLIASLLRKMEPPIRVHTRGGDTLVVDFERQEQKFKSIFLEGPAEIVFHGELFYDELRGVLTNTSIAKE